MYRSILVPVDGSTFAEHAVPWARLIARLADAELMLILVHETPLLSNAEAGPLVQLERWDMEHRRSEQTYLHVLAERVAEEAGRPVGQVLTEGPDVVTALEQRIRDQGADLVVMTTHGRAGLQRAWLGSVADGLIRRARCPVLLIRPTSDEISHGAEARPFRRILVALDGSEIAEAALPHARSLARLCGARLTLLRVVAPPAAISSPYIPHQTLLNREELDRRQEQARAYLDARVAQLMDEGPLDADTRVSLDYHAAHGILQAAQDEDADLIVTGSHGRGAISRLVMGSVADKVVRAAEVPVLVCRG